MPRQGKQFRNELLSPLYQVIIAAMSAFLPTALAQAAITTPIKHSHGHNLIETERVIS